MHRITQATAGLDPRCKAAQQGVLSHLEGHPLVLDFGTGIRDLLRDL